MNQPTTISWRSAVNRTKRPPAWGQTINDPHEHRDLAGGARAGHDSSTGLARRSERSLDTFVALPLEWKLCLVALGAVLFMAAHFVGHRRGPPPGLPAFVSLDEVV